jgi:hypothetical protein
MRTLILFAALASTVSGAAAQQLHFGIKGGASYTKLNGIDHDQLTSASNAYRPGFHAGAVAEIAVTNHLFIQPELLYSQKGGRNKLAHGYQTIFSYLDLPILAKIATGKTGAFVEAGPQLGYVIRATSKANDYSYQVRDLYEKVDIGYVAGLGYQLASGPFVGLRYNGGITRINKPVINNGSIYATDDTRNGAFQLYAGYLFGGH